MIQGSGSRRRYYCLGTKKKEEEAETYTPNEKQVDSNQKPLECTHPTECCIMKRKDGECHMKANFHKPDLQAKLYTILLCSNLDLPNLSHSSQGMLSLTDPTGCCTMKKKD